MALLVKKKYVLRDLRGAPACAEVQARERQRYWRTSVLVIVVNMGNTGGCCLRLKALRVAGLRLPPAIGQESP